MRSKQALTGCAFLLLLAAGCTKKPAPAPPTPPAPAPVPQNVVVLLPDPDGKSGAVTVTNSGGAQALGQSYQAVRIERTDTAPTAPFPMEQAEVRRVFGAALDVLPAAEVQFVLYFVEGTDTLTPASQAQLPAIFNAVRERRSTAVSVTGHTDTTGDPKSNYELGLKRAQRVANLLTAQGLDASQVFVDSHGETDLAVKTARGVAEQRNRRVEVIVR